MKRRILTVLPAIFLLSNLLAVAQKAVPVREEPRHKPVFENEYVRILDVWLPAGDTTLYHIHSTPSLFNFFTNAKLSTQIRQGPWELSTPVAGFSWYKSFENDTLIHRIINVDTVACHVMDIELLRMYNSSAGSGKTPLPFELLYENERAAAYRIESPEFGNFSFHNRGPVVAELVAGEGIVYNNKTLRQSMAFRPGMYIYIAPGHSFQFSNQQQLPVHMVLFELK